MYYYLSFLRPPPTSIDLAVPGPAGEPGVVITPQIANDLRTELLDDRPTKIYYTWTSRPPLTSSSSSSYSVPRARHHTGFLTTYEPPASTYKSNKVPLPRGCRAGEVWYLGLSAHTDGQDVTNEKNDEKGDGTEHEGSTGSELIDTGVRQRIPLRKGRIVDVWSRGITITSTSSSSSSSSSTTGKGKSSSTPNPSKASKGTKGNKPSKPDGGKKGDKGEGPKQTSIVRTWGLPSRGRCRAGDGTDSGSGSISSLGRKEQDDHVDSEAGRETEMGMELGRKSEAGVGRALKRDSQGIPKAVVPDEAGHADVRLDEEEKEEEDGERFLSVIEETSFDLDKKIWDSGLALASYFIDLELRPRSGLPSTSSALPLDMLERLNRPRARVLEIGAGTGLVGIGLAASGLSSGARIMITDLPSAIPLIDENIVLNESLWESDARVRSGVLDWDDEVPDWVWNWDEPEGKIAPLDVIVAADVTYNTDSFPALLSTLSRLFTPPPSASSTTTPLLLLAYKQRHAAERTLWPALERIGIELTKFDTIMGHEEDLGVDVVTGRDEEEGEEVRSGMGGTELWIGRKKVSP